MSEEVKLSEFQEDLLDRSIEDLLSIIDNKSSQIEKYGNMLEELHVEIAQTKDVLQKQLVTIESQYFPKPKEAPELEPEYDPLQDWADSGNGQEALEDPPEIPF